MAITTSGRRSSGHRALRITAALSTGRRRSGALGLRVKIAILATVADRTTTRIRWRLERHRLVFASGYNCTPAGLPMLLPVAESGSSMGNLAGVVAVRRHRHDVPVPLACSLGLIADRRRLCQYCEQPSSDDRASALSDARARFACERLLVAQSDHGIDAHGAARRDVARG
jgi:hypothetical protein